MPIALLPDLAIALADLAKRLNGWGRLAPLEEQILRRARGAFLVRWFGPMVPEHQLNLHIAIANIAALRDRLEQARQSMPGRDGGMNLLRPLASIYGTLVGIGMSVPGVVAIYAYLPELFGLFENSATNVVKKILFFLLAWTLPVSGPALMLGLGLPLAGALAFGEALGDQREVRAIYGLTGDAALMIDALLRFWDQISGPVDQIRNPLLRALAILANRFAELFAQGLGFVALIVVKVLPLIPRLLEQYRAAEALGSQVFGIVAEATSDIVDVLKDVFDQGALSAILATALDAVMQLPVRILESLNFLIGASLTEFGYAKTAFDTLLTEWTSGLAARIRKEFEATPVGQMVDRLKALAALKPALIKAFAERPVGEPKAGGGGSGKNKLDEIEADLRGFWSKALTGGLIIGKGVGERIADVISAARGLVLPTKPATTIPDFPSLPTLPDAPALHSLIAAPAPLDLGAEASRLLDAASKAETSRKLPAALNRRPKSVFRGLLAENPPPAAPDATALLLRDAIYIAVGRVLPPALRAYAPTLREAFDKLDKEIYGIAPTAGPLPEHPQLDLPDSGLLRPVVAQLTIRSRGGYAPDLRAFRDMVTEAMQAQSYLAPAAV